LTAKEDVAAEHHALYDELAALRGRLSGPATIVMYSPALSKPWNDQSEFLHREVIVERGHYELASATASMSGARTRRPRANTASPRPA
jgi:hypothetical protein